ncbi:hypothetical protein E2C01_084195 [Portunus trituberculatus]|uniref:Uncharacterized protein n=1 Tax=Portunus trituberculatus TaxID=210409 RepID=A0A5B7J8L4_PORTR|nr:hypothetical protein [Portunus trituberculatus]
MVKVSWCLCLLAAVMSVTAAAGISARHEATTETAVESEGGGGAPHSHSAPSTGKGKAGRESKGKTRAEDFTRRNEARRHSSHSRTEEALGVPEGRTAEVPDRRLLGAAEGAASLSPADNQEEIFSVVADRTSSHADEAERAVSLAADGALPPPAAEVADRSRLPRAERDQAPLRSHLPQPEQERGGRFRNRYGSSKNRSSSEGSQSNRFVTDRNQKNRYGSDKNRYSTAENRRHPSRSARKRVTPEEGKRRSARGGGNTDRFPSQPNKYNRGSRYTQGGDRSRRSTNTRRFIPAARPGEGSKRGRGASEPAWLAWYNTLPWRQEMLSQYGESQRPQRSSFGL